LHLCVIAETGQGHFQKKQGIDYDESLELNFEHDHFVAFQFRLKEPDCWSKILRDLLKSLFKLEQLNKKVSLSQNQYIEEIVHKFFFREISKVCLITVSFDSKQVSGV
jgi:hypothetical protein